MVLLLTAGLVLLAVLIGLFAVSIAAGKLLQLWRARRHYGLYRVRVGPAAGRGRDGTDVEQDLESLDDARVLAREVLVQGDQPGHVAFVLAARDDGEWDVVDRIDVL